MFIERITVEDVRKQALPLGTHVVAGKGLLGRPVSWASVVYPEYSAPVRLPQEGELILLASQPRNSAPVTTEIDVVRHASDTQAAAVVLSDTPSPATVAEANTYNIPLLVLPGNSRIRMVEQAVISLLVDRKGQLEQRGAQIYRQLARITSNNGGMPELINAISRLTEKTVVIQDKRLRVLYSSVQPHLVDSWGEVEHFLTRHDNLPTDFQDRSALPKLTALC